MKNYFAGRAGLSKDDLVGYLKEFLVQHNSLNLKWSEITIETLATKYLSFMTKLGFLNGARTRTFQHTKTSAESLVLFLYFSQITEPENKNILTNKILPLSFAPTEDIQERLKKLSSKGLFNMNFNGVALNIELIHSYKGICDVLYR
jgi:isocitrate dehydrogenase kinase/phosphatase